MEEKSKRIEFLQPRDTNELLKNLFESNVGKAQRLILSDRAYDIIVTGKHGNVITIQIRDLGDSK